MHHLKFLFPALAFLPAILFGQDPFFTHFYGNEALFNPALTGYLGALSISLKAKQQWNSQGVEGYETYQLAMEESMPCSFFDYGLSVMQDTEGEGRLRTRQFGGMLAAPLRLENSQLSVGIGLHWGQQSVDYSRLLFIDQLHPKYGLSGPDGLPIPTAFTPPNDGLSNWYFQPSAGVAYRYIINPDSKYAPNISAGMAVHNLVPWAGAKGRGHSWSVLGLGTPTVPRFTYFLRAEILLSYIGKDYISLRPQLFAQSQRGLAYLEGGLALSLSRQFSLAFFLHASRPNEGAPATNWGSIQLETGFFPGDNARMDLGFGYSYNFSGLRNYVGGVYEFTLRFSLASSPMCNLAGDPAPYDKGRKRRSLPCPTLSQTSRKNKIYENIWYRANP